MPNITFVMTCTNENDTINQAGTARDETAKGGNFPGSSSKELQGGRSADGTPGVPKEEAQRIPEDLVAQLVRKALHYI